MKRITAALCVILAIIISALPMGSFAVIAAGTDVKIDGDVSDWDGTPFIDLGRGDFSPWVGSISQEFTMQASFTLKGDYLYMYVKVTDNKLIMDNGAGTHHYNGDVIQTAFKYGNNDKRFFSVGCREGELWIADDKNDNARANDSVAYGKRTGDGWAAEFKYNLSTICGQSVSASDPFKLKLLLTYIERDDDNEGVTGAWAINEGRTAEEASWGNEGFELTLFKDGSFSTSPAYRTGINEPSYSVTLKKGNTTLGIVPVPQSSGTVTVKEFDAYKPADGSEKFIGWSLSENGAVLEGSISVTEDITVYALTEAALYTLTFKYEGLDSAKEDDVIEYEYDTRVSLDAARFAQEGYSVKFLDESGKNVSSVRIAGDTVVRVVYTKGGSGNASDEPSSDSTPDPAVQPTADKGSENGKNSSSGIGEGNVVPLVIVSVFALAAIAVSAVVIVKSAIKLKRSKEE